MVRDRLHVGVLGDGLAANDRAKYYLAVVRFALRATAEGLLAGTAQLLIRDQVLAEVLEHLRTARQSFLDVGLDHACLVVEAAMGLLDGLLHMEAGDGGFAARSAKRSAGWEHRADEMVNRRRMVTRANNGEVFERLLTASDDSIDHLEEAAFLLTLLAEGADPQPLLPSLRSLAEAAVAAARELQPGSRDEDLRDVLEAVDRVMALEHRADDATGKRSAQSSPGPPISGRRRWPLEMARSIEEASDALMRSALVLRDSVLGERIQG